MKKRKPILNDYNSYNVNNKYDLIIFYFYYFIKYFYIIFIFS